MHYMFANITDLLAPIAELSLPIMLQAERQAYSEDLYNQLVQIAYEGMYFLNKLKEGDVLPPEWVVERDALIERANNLFRLALVK